MVVMNCKYCNKETDGTMVFHPMLKPSKQFYPDVCQECISTLVDCQDWSISKIFNN